MALYTGVTGKIAIKKGEGASKEIAHMANWTVDFTREIIEVVSFGEEYKEKIPSIKDWSASFDGKADFAAASGQKDLLDAFEDGSELEASFYLDDDTFLAGTSYVESLSFTDAADGAVDTSISLAGSGANILTLPSGG